MAGEYASDVESFLVHEDVTWRESISGTTFLVGLAAISAGLGILLWWRRRAT